MRRVLDAHGLMVFLEEEAGFEKVENLLAAAAEKDEPLLMTTVNAGEVYYVVLRECGEEKAAQIEKIMRTLPIRIVDADWTLTREAARLKATCKMSYADCFAAALTKLNKAELVTGDPEFKGVQSVIKIDWL